MKIELNDKEKIEIQRFLDNEAMKNAVRKMILNEDSSIEMLLTLGKSHSLDDEQLGSNLRAYSCAKKMLDENWKKMEELKFIQSNETKEFNNAR